MSRPLLTPGNPPGQEVDIVMIGKETMIGKNLCLLFCFMVCTTAPLAAAGNSGRWFDVYGCWDFTLFPPHNEQDLNLRGYTPMWQTGEGYDWFGDAYPRYGLGLNLTLEPRRYNKVFILFNPYVPMGQTIPQIDYGWSLKPIGVRLHFGMGYHLTDHLDILFQHHNWEFFGKYQNVMIKHGPYGHWNGITTRYRFDTRGH
jgi:hypothetical protein